MATSTPSPELRHYLSELALAEAAASAAITRVEALRKVVEGLRALEQTSAASAPRLFEVQTATPPKATQLNEPSEPLGPAPRGREAVRGVLVQTRKAWKIPDLADEIERRGWMPDVVSKRDATAATVQRLVKDGEAERVGHGVYRYRLDKLPPLDLAASKEDSEG